MLSPITPHLAEELWQILGHRESITRAPWPNYDPQLLVEETVTIVIQVNGKLRGNLTVAKTADKAMLEQLALAHPAVEKQLAGAAPQKIVVVPGRLVNIVI